MTHSFLTTFVERVERERLNLHGIVISRAGSVLAEHHFIPEAPHVLRSISKSFTSCAVGIAEAEGVLSLDDRAADFFSAGQRCGADVRMSDLTVRHLLQMAHGRTAPVMMSDQRAVIADTDWVRFYLTAPLQVSPGARFCYDTGATYLLSAVLQEVTRETLLSYLTPRLFEPLGIVDPRWESCPQGRTLGGAGLFLSVSDLNRFGRLLLQRGRWQGTELVPERYLEQATTKQIDTGHETSGVDWTLGYGYQFWVCRHGAYRGDGSGGQFCIVLPKLDAVIAITAWESRMQMILDAVWEAILPGL
ncbi:MAG: serine hydrolase [Trueperaceae bacterium]|nr:MAG: serine hydrolase [Trueperaceae bacterium]